MTITIQHPTGVTLPGPDFRANREKWEASLKTRPPLVQMRIMPKHIEILRHVQKHVEVDVTGTHRAVSLARPTADKAMRNLRAAGLLSVRKVKVGNGLVCYYKLTDKGARVTMQERNEGQ
jgi:DNA-binding transcriptional ArsR family regulator